jgi:selenocysteine-specific elongation factor
MTMHVVATAGHVDHGKSTLVRALTGMEPDRLAEERRRGMTLDLGFAWARLPSGHDLAFVDVPGHERFVRTMITGAGPAPAAVVVVAADGGWMPQSAEHLAVLDALQVSHGLLVISRCDLAAPEGALAAARNALAGTTLSGIEAVAVSASTGAGLDEVRAALDRLVEDLPVPDPSAPVRLWVDRCFSVQGAGTVVTGTLGAGTVRVEDELVVNLGTGRRARVRGLQVAGNPVAVVNGTARVAVNLRAVQRNEIGRGAALTTPGSWAPTSLVDVKLNRPVPRGLPRSAMLHIGSAAVPVRVRPLGIDAARLSLDTELPLRLGDRMVIRDPGTHQVVGVVAVDVRPPSLARRGSAAARARELVHRNESGDAVAELSSRGVMRGADLRLMGAPPTQEPVAGDWFVDPHLWEQLGSDLVAEAHAYAAANPLAAGMPLEAARERLRLPDVVLVRALVGTPPCRALQLVAGRIVLDRGATGLPGPLREAFDQLRAELLAAPFAAPTAERLAGLGLGRSQLAALIRVGALVKVGDGVYLLPPAPADAGRLLAGLTQPFTVGQARQALDTTRRVAVPLLEMLDREHVTIRLADGRRTLRPPAGAVEP